jgi:hypothetical protein
MRSFTPGAVNGHRADKAIPEPGVEEEILVGVEALEKGRQSARHPGLEGQAKIPLAAEVVGMEGNDAGDRTRAIAGEFDGAQRYCPIL